MFSGVLSSRSDRWERNRSASRALDRKVSSTPNSTSARGLSLVRMAWLTREPVSPAGTISTATPVSAVNGAKVSSVTPPAKES